MKATKHKENLIELTPDFEYDARLGRIKGRDKKEFFLEPRLKSFLTVLAEKKNDLVTREELMEAVWQGVVVNDESITKAASDLRRVLAQNGINDIELTTVPKVGYMLEDSFGQMVVERPTNPLTLIAKSIGYVVMAILLIIVLVRAINY